MRRWEGSEMKVGQVRKVRGDEGRKISGWEVEEVIGNGRKGGRGSRGKCMEMMGG